MITAQDVRELLAERPFEPFRIVTSSGKYYDIPHSDFVFVTKRTLKIGTPKMEGNKDPDGVHVVSILHVTALEEIQTKPKKK
jgi:hypothetical protein